MKPIRQILVAALLTIALFSVIAYTACKKDPCDNVICLNLGSCNGGGCVCPTGYEGIRCQTLSRDKFINTFNGGDTCSGIGYRQYPVYFRAELADPLEIKILHFLNDNDDSAIGTMRSLDSFTFQGSNNSTTYYGYAKLRHDSLWMTYHVDHDTTSYNCNYFGQGLR